MECSFGKIVGRDLDSAKLARLFRRMQTRNFRTSFMSGM
jgi:hypothetical protein